MSFLHGVVRQVPIKVTGVVAELFDAGAQVTLLVPVSVKLTGDWGDQDVAADVEFAVAVKEGRDVVLDETTFVFLVQLEDGGDYALLAFYYGNSLSSVSVLAWFDYKKAILINSFIHKHLFHL